MSNPIETIPKPIRIVVDISGGALHDVSSDAPVEVLFISWDGDDVASAQEGGDDNICTDMSGDPVAWWLLKGEGTEEEREVVEHYHAQRPKVTE